MNTIYKLLILFVLLLMGTFKSFATTWDEPWAEKIIKEADYFVLADIISYDDKSVKLRIVKQLGGEKLPVELEITNFYLLRLMSSSAGHGAEFDFQGIDQSYFFIKKNSKGEFCISTPTSGFDYVQENNVSATYRHSYHQALVPIEIYELTMSAIFNNYHNLNYNKHKITTFIDSMISKKPAGFSEDEINTFFLQHVALETIFHLRIEKYHKMLLPFFNDNSNFHNRVSASRALIANNNTEVIDLLLNKIATNTEDDFTTVICIWTLKEFKPKDIKTDLEKLHASASTKENGFGGNIMDSRVGTSFPTVKDALEELIKTL